MNPSFINNISIVNFKSIEKLSLNTSRVNLFIGKPNVGKSNILEAISMFCLPSGISQNPRTSQMEVKEEFIRYEIVKDFFHFSDVTKEIKIDTDKGSLLLSKDGIGYVFVVGETKAKIMELLKDARENYSALIEKLPQSQSLVTDGKFNSVVFYINEDGHINLNQQYYYYITHVKKYDFKRFTSAHEEKGNIFTGFLSPPNGNNLFALIQSHPGIRRIANDYFKEYQLDFVLRQRDNTFEIQRREHEGSVDSIPFSLTADTLQRMIFYKAAILSNKNSILIFEEPESHAYPKYVDELGELINESKSNQFFITTHSPYLIQSILKNESADDIALFIVDYDNYNTTARLVSKDEVQQIYDEGVDVFFNLNVFGVK